MYNLVLAKKAPKDDSLMSKLFDILKILVLILFLFCAQICFAEINTLPSFVNTEMLNGLYSERSEIGDKVQVRLLEPVNLPNERIFIPIDSIIEGQVVEVREAERGLRGGKMKVAFNRVYYPNGYFMDLEAYLIGSKSETINTAEAPEVKGKTSWGQRLLQIGKVGTGAFLGGPIGATAAVGSLIFDKGGKIRIQAGETVKIQLNALKWPENYNVKGKITDIYSPQTPVNSGY